MRKSDKKIENQLRLVLTDVCENALEEVTGFQWLTHVVNYDHFPQSLKVTCVFDTNVSLDTYLQSTLSNQLLLLIQTALTGINIKIKNIAQHVFYDTEENCDKHHQGNWANRLG